MDVSCEYPHNTQSNSMMSANINLAVLQFVIAAFVSGTLMGFAFRSRQMAKSKRRILELETEMVENHAEILRLHKVYSNKQGELAVIWLDHRERVACKLSSPGLFISLGVCGKSPVILWRYIQQCFIVVN